MGQPEDILSDYSLNDVDDLSGRLPRAIPGRYLVSELRVKVFTGTKGAWAVCEGKVLKSIQTEAHPPMPPDAQFSTVCALGGQEFNSVAMGKKNLGNFLSAATGLDDATLKSVKVVKFNKENGEVLLRAGVQVDMVCYSDKSQVKKQDIKPCTFTPIPGKRLVDLMPNVQQWIAAPTIGLQARRQGPPQQQQSGSPQQPWNGQQQAGPPQQPWNGQQQSGPPPQQTTQWSQPANPNQVPPQPQWSGPPPGQYMQPQYQAPQQAPQQPQWVGPPGQSPQQQQPSAQPQPQWNGPPPGTPGWGPQQ